ncbi:MAG: helicase-related protein [Methanothermobacter tenebrarum]
MVIPLLEEGSIVEGPYWPEPLKIKSIEKIDEDTYHITGVLVNSRRHEENILSEDDLERLDSTSYIIDFSAPGDEFFLALESCRYKNASSFDPLLAMNTSIIDPLPFQLDAVYLHALKMPHLRFMIADDPGAGKTIMAGLIIKELKLRGVVERILIVTPGHLTRQWRREMDEKFQEKFIIVDRAYMNSYQSENPWRTGQQYITSMDFAKQKDVMGTLSGIRWDLVVVDEAHKMSARPSGGSIRKTKRYRLGELLSKNSDHLLFLTATPHNGDRESFRLFLDLLKPGFFANEKLIEEARQKNDNPLFIRRTKEELRDFDGKPIFKKRQTFTIKFLLSDEEMELYSQLSKYVQKEYKRSLSHENRYGYVFALLLLQRRMASSIYALLKSLKRRKRKCEKLLEDAEATNIIKEPLKYEDEEESKRWEIERKLELLTPSETREELKAEIKTLKRLIGMAEEILGKGEETKLQQLKKILKKIGDEKLLIFTESKDTVQYLERKLKEWNYKVCTIHGEMNMEERIQAERDFKENKQIMVATEAAGEGINLQFCHIMVNYDIPWNPNRLEQRMGRIHRYKQEKDVQIYNLVARNTTEGRVLLKLLEKLENIRKDMGDRIYDVVGEIYTEKKLYDIIERSFKKRSLKEEEIDKEFKTPKKLLESILGEQLTTKVNYAKIKEIREAAEEKRLVPEYLEGFFQKVFQMEGWKYEKKGDTYRIRTTPHQLRKIKKELKKTYNVTFKKEKADQKIEYISYGHPLFEAILEYIEKEYAKSLHRGSTFKDPTGRYNGLIWFFQGEVTDGNNETAGKKIFSIYDNGKEYKEVDPIIIWDLIPEKRKIEDQPDKEKVKKHIIRLLQNYKKEIEKDREKKAKIKEEYGLRSIEYLIILSQEKISEYYKRLEEGESMELPLREEEKRLEYYKEKKKELIDEINKEKTLKISMPRFLGVIHVRADPTGEDPNIEKIGMELSMEYERKQGRNPQDVSNQNLGYDIKSTSNNETRYIEVKSRKNETNIQLTKNEWTKAKRFQDKYWLYIIYNATTKPKLIKIQNPAKKLKPTKKEEITYIITPNQIKQTPTQ